MFLIVFNGLSLIETYAVLTVSFLWVLDLKMEIYQLLKKPKALLDNFEEILEHYSKLKYSFGHLSFIVFCLTQLMCIASGFLSFEGKKIILLHFTSLKGFITDLHGGRPETTKLSHFSFI